MRYLTRVQSKNPSDDCRVDGHAWRPITRMDGTPPDQWHWTCARCHLLVKGQPEGVNPIIALKDLEAMVDSSVRLADTVIVDDQTVKGELWLMRNVHWTYFPYSFQILYHVLKGMAFVVLFRYAELPTAGIWTQWKNVPDTNTYRALLAKADGQRMRQFYITTMKVT